MDALTLLKSDHRKVERLFARYRSANGSKAGIVRQITEELTAHMDAEERELYPILRTSIEDGQSLMEDAVKEHAEARGLLAELSRGEEGSFDVDARVATLRRAIEHHVSDEEQDIFPKTREALGKTRLAEIGSRIALAKKAAPKSPPASAARRSPGASVVGVMAAATDRVKNLLIPPIEEMSQPARRAGKRRKRTAAKSRARATKSRARASKSRAGATKKTASMARARKGRATTARKATSKKVSARAGGTRSSRKRVVARKSKG
jgi:hemerythrin superfamily protein